MNIIVSINMQPSVKFFIAIVLASLINVDIELRVAIITLLLIIEIVSSRIKQTKGKDNVSSTPPPIKSYYKSNIKVIIIIGGVLALLCIPLIPRLIQIARIINERQLEIRRRQPRLLIVRMANLPDFIHI